MQKEKWDELDGIGRDDALGSFDPYNTGMYKGVAVSTEVQVTEVSRMKFSLFLWFVAAETD